MISQTAEYALRALVCLSSQQEVSLTARQMARSTHVPAGYLSKVLQSLVRSGFLTSHRGLRGGFALARSPKEMTVLEVVNAVDPLRRIECCPLGLQEHGEELCPLHRRLDQVVAEVQRSFGELTVGELLAEPGPGGPLGLGPMRPKRSPPTAGNRAAQ